MTFSQTPRTDHWSTLSDPWPRAFEWIERTMAGEVVSFRRQAHWRPTWFIDVCADGQLHHAYFRCQREENLPRVAGFPSNASTASCGRCRTTA